jgi:hypothetical protein
MVSVGLLNNRRCTTILPGFGPESLNNISDEIYILPVIFKKLKKPYLKWVIDIILVP